MKNYRKSVVIIMGAVLAVVLLSLSACSTHQALSPTPLLLPNSRPQIPPVVTASANLGTNDGSDGGYYYPQNASQFFLDMVVHSDISISDGKVPRYGTIGWDILSNKLNETGTYHGFDGDGKILQNNTINYVNGKALYTSEFIGTLAKIFRVNVYFSHPSGTSPEVQWELYAWAPK